MASAAMYGTITAKKKRAEADKADKEDASKVKGYVKRWKRRTGVGVAPHDRLRPSFQLDMAGAPMSEAEHTPLAEHNNPPARKRSSVSSFNMPQRLHSLGGDSIAEDAGDAAELAPSSADDSADDLWCISLNGRMFEVSSQVLLTSEIKVLAMLAPTLDCAAFLAERSHKTGQFHFYLPRRASAFEAVLMYLQGELLCAPLELCPQAWEAELRYYGLPYGDCKRCSYKPPAAPTRKGSEPGSLSSALVEPAREPDPPKRTLRMNIWAITDGEGWDATSAKVAKAFIFVSMTFLFASVVTFCLETLPTYRLEDVEECTSSATVAPTATNANYSNGNASATFGPTTTSTVVCNMVEQDKTNYALNMLEAVFIGYFTLELIIRLYASPSRAVFCKGALNIIDFIAVMPFYIFLLAGDGGGDAGGFALIRAIRLVRVFRIFKLSRHSAGLQIFGTSLYRSRNELMQLGVFLSIAVILFASAIYHAEYRNHSEMYGSFDSIPASFWWAIVTMTTVGYGDMVPQTGLGKIIGAGCAVTGILVLALPIPIFVSNFQELFEEYNRTGSIAPLPRLPGGKKTGNVFSRCFKKKRRGRHGTPVPQDTLTQEQIARIVDAMAAGAKESHPDVRGPEADDDPSGAGAHPAGSEEDEFIPRNAVAREPSKDSLAVNSISNRRNSAIFFEDNSVPSSPERGVGRSSPERRAHGDGSRRTGSGLGGVDAASSNV